MILHNRPPRKAFTLLVALLCCLLAALLIGAIMQSLSVGSNTIRSKQRRIQTIQLAEAGLQLANQRLSLDADYSGETWIVDAEPLAVGSAEDEAHVTITVDEEVINVTAVYPVESPHQCRVTKSIRRNRETNFNDQLENK